jgi:hypothetical protein
MKTLIRTSFFVLLLFTCILTQAQNPDTVKIGAYIINLHDIDFRNKEYTIRFWLWTLYKNPSFDFAQQLDIPNAKEIEIPNPQMDLVDGTTWQLMKLKCKMMQDWEVRDFPFDKQHLTVRVENSIYDKNRMVFVVDSLGSAYDRELTLEGWRINQFKVTTAGNEYTTVFGDPSSNLLHSEYDAFQIELDIERDAWGLFFKIFIGMYFAFLISIISFTLQPQELEPRFGLPVGGLFAAVGNKYIIDSILPESTSFTLVDTLHTITYLSILVTLTVSAIALHYFDIGKTEKSITTNKIGSRLVIGLYILTNAIVIFNAIS